MTFLVDNSVLFSARPLGIHALRLRLRLIELHERCIARLPPEERVGHSPIGLTIPAAEIRRMIGLGGANDARSLRRAIDDLQDDPAIETLWMRADGREVTFTLDPALRDRSYHERYTLVDDADIPTTRSVAELILALRWAQARRMLVPYCDIAPEFVAAMRGGAPAPADARWLSRTVVPAAGRLAARNGIRIAILAAWAADMRAPPRLRLRFDPVATPRWSARSLRSIRAHEHGWLVSAGGAERLARMRVRLVHADAPCLRAPSRAS